MAYLEQSTRYIAYDARLGGRYRYYRDPDGARRRRSAPATSATWTGCSTPTPSCVAGCMTECFRERFPKDPDDSDFVYRQAIRAKAFDSLRGVLPAASLSNVGIYGTGQALREAAAAHARPPAARGAGLRRPHARASSARSSLVPQAGRPRRPGRGLDALPRGDPHRDRRASPSRLLLAGRDRASRRRRSRSSTSIPTPRSSWSPRCSTRTPTCPSASCEHGCGAMTDRRARAPCCGPTWGSGPTAGTSRAGARAVDVPVRRAGRLRRVPRPPAPPHAHHRVAAAVAPPRVHAARGGRRRRRTASDVRRRDGALGRPVRRLARAVPAAGALRRLPGVQASASPCR